MQKTAWHLTTGSWAIIHIATGFSACFLAFSLSPAFEFRTSQDIYQHATAMMASSLFSLCLLLMTYVFDLASLTQSRSQTWIIIQIISCTLLTTLIFSLTLSLLFYSRVGRYILIQTFLYTCIWLIAMQLLARYMGQKHRKRIVLVGNQTFLDNFKPQIQQTHLPFKLAGTFLSDEASDEGFHQLDENGEIKPESLSSYCQHHHIHQVLWQSKLNYTPKQAEELEACMFAQVQVNSPSAFIEKVHQKIALEYIDPSWVYEIDLRMSHPFYHKIKSIGDKAIGLLGCIASTPFILTFGILVKLQDGGPIFFTQKRIGLMGKAFTIYKLRTMRHNPSDPSQWAQKEDPRITLLGKFLRKTRIDELPQFWNVLRGDMSLIGPRPEQPPLVQTLRQEIPLYDLRHLMLPGITGWAQINYPYGASVQDARNKLSYDLYYLKHHSFILDTLIFLRTIGAMMKGSR